MLTIYGSDSIIFIVLLTMSALHPIPTKLLPIFAFNFAKILLTPCLDEPPKLLLVLSPENAASFVIKLFEINVSYKYFTPMPDVSPGSYCKSRTFVLIPLYGKKKRTNTGKSLRLP